MRSGCAEQSMLHPIKSRFAQCVQVQQPKLDICFQNDKISEHVAFAGAIKINQPTVPVRIDKDIACVQIAMRNALMYRHTRVPVREPGQRVGQFAPWLWQCSCRRVLVQFGSNQSDRLRDARAAGLQFERLEIQLADVRLRNRIAI